MDELNRGIETLAQRARLGKLFCWLFIGAFILTIPFDLLQITGSLDLDVAGPFLMPAAAAYLGASLVFLLSVVFVSMWIHRAHANLFAAGVEGLEFTPGWSVGWFFIPIMNLFKPFQAMRELWNRSHGDDDGYNAGTPSDVGTWWGCYIAGNILSSIGQRIETMGGSDGAAAGVSVGMIGTLILVGSAWFLIKIIDRIGTAQRSMMGIAETFA